jgi:hypothetical protein
MPALKWESVQSSGLTWVADADQADVRVSGRMTLTVPKGGKREAAIDWSVTDARNNTVTHVRYTGTVSKPATSQEWLEFKRGAVEALAVNIAGTK